MMMLSYAEGETPKTYPEVAEVNLRSLLTELSTVADAVVVDTATHQNRIDRFVLAQSPKQVCIATADVKGFYYRQNHAAHGGEEQVLFVNSPDSALSDVIGTYNGPVAVLPFCRGLSGLYNGISITDVIPPRKYRRAQYRIIGDLS